MNTKIQYTEVYGMQQKQYVEGTLLPTLTKKDLNLQPYFKSSGTRQRRRN